LNALQPQSSHNFSLFLIYVAGSFSAYFQSRDYDVADTVDFVADIGDKVEVDFVASVYAALVAHPRGRVLLF